MQISNAHIQKVMEVHLHKVYATDGKRQTSASGTDQFVLSSRAADMQRAKDAISSLPPVRPEVVEAARASVLNGDYQISSSDIADSILGGR